MDHEENFDEQARADVLRGSLSEYELDEEDLALLDIELDDSLFRATCRPYRCWQLLVAQTLANQPW
jgi:hypothetical protein